jgi:phosphoribosyl-ATP pyrophosphohydrolase
MSYCSYLEELFEDMSERSRNLEPHESYTAYLSSLTNEAVGKKFMEEAFELAVANIEMNEDKGRSELVGEAADVVYHLMALLITKNVDFKEVIGELKSRGGVKKVDEINFKKN